ncbi:Uncharacterized protein TCM_033887 [Theobroma cacao]|uniref:Uncharacterized protein n=1 Tax=Theobroma cacao TaxID=3641 RepID=A0A061FJ61_THECC|nr:Uncharacterized protein TCM_033887 [Theobroma cacao]
MLLSKGHCGDLLVRLKLPENRTEVGAAEAALHMSESLIVKVCTASLHFVHDVKVSYVLFKRTNSGPSLSFCSSWILPDSPFWDD